MFGLKIIDKLVLLFFLFFEYKPAIGGITGKISGKISDKNTNDPLAGVNIFLVGQKRGAATNLNGEYFILQVVPGKYDVQVIMIGYKELLIKNVEVILVTKIKVAKDKII